MKSFILVVLISLLFFPALVLANTEPDLDSINQKVSNRFEEDVSRLAAIMDEVRERQGIKETRVAFGGIDDKIKSADYWVTFAAEAIAYQRAQKFSSTSTFRSSLETLKGKVLRAKAEVAKALP